MIGTSGTEIMEEHHKALAEKSKLVQSIYSKLKPHISFLNDLVMFATFVNTSYAILVLLHPNLLIQCRDVDTQDLQMPSAKVRLLCDPSTSQTYLYDSYLYTFVFNIVLFVLIIYLSRWCPFKLYADIISVILVVTTLVMLLAKIFMIFYVPVIQAVFSCPNVGNFTYDYCTEKSIEVNSTTGPESISCSQNCEVHPNMELYLLGLTLILSFFYMCYLLYLYHDSCKPVPEKVVELKKNKPEEKTDAENEMENSNSNQESEEKRDSEKTGLLQDGAG
eukprot:Phypoly_transcript_11790.p1 GENE.Phypoly_transcript_11790~~Phypoly_transcript_11790.p1  ORF type:complete len:277 (+),score=36.21 Phypoly_transcript_11790:335-1165(+)